MSYHNRNNFFSGLIWGVILGAGAYWFLTKTEEGKRIKSQLQEKAEGALDELGEIAAELEEKGEEFSQKIGEFQEKLEEKIPSTEKPKKEKPIKKFFTKNGRKLT